MKKRRKPIILSASIIAGNEEGWITPIIEDCKGFADEIVVLCSGSDKTEDICRDLGCKVYPFKWVNDFAAARNECLKHCSGRYAIWVDCDDRIIPSQQERIRNLKGHFLRKPEDYAFQLSLVDKKNDAPAFSLGQIRIFPILNHEMWSGIVHETVVGATKHLVSCETNIWVYHEGYQDKDVFNAKIRRNIPLLAKSTEENKSDAIRLSYLGASLSNAGKTKEAWDHMRKAYEIFEKSPHKPSKFTYFMRLFPILWSEKLYTELWGVMELAKKVYPTDPQPVAVQAKIAAIKNNLPLAIELIDAASKLEYVEEQGMPVISNVKSLLVKMREEVIKHDAYLKCRKAEEEIRAEIDRITKEELETVNA